MFCICESKQLTSVSKVTYLLNLSFVLIIHHSFITHLIFILYICVYFFFQQCNFLDLSEWFRITMCKWDWLFSVFLFAESWVRGFGLLPAVNQVLSLRTWTCAYLLEPLLWASHISSELSRTNSTNIIAPLVAVMFAVSQKSSRHLSIFYQRFEASRTVLRWSWHLKEKGTKPAVDLSGKRILPFDFGIFTANCFNPACCLFFSNELSSSSLVWEMPTNQSSPWNVGNPRCCSNAEKFSTTSKTSKVPYSQASIELARSKEQAKAPACNAASSVSQLRLMTVNPPMLSREKKTAEGPFTTVRHVCSNMPQQLNGIQILKPILVTGLSENNIVTRMSAPSSIQKTECQVGLLAS